MFANTRLGYFSHKIILNNFFIIRMFVFKIIIILITFNIIILNKIQKFKYYKY